MVYIATFLSSMLFGYWATRINPKTNRGLVFLCSLISILIPSILAGLRDVSIGTDVSGYIESEFNIAIAIDSFKEYFSLIWKKEKGYLLLVFVIAKYFGDIHWLLFFMSFITMTCIYVGAWKFRKDVSLSMILLLYFCFFYNDSYNMVRQSMSMSIVFMAIPYLFEKKYVKYLVFILIASLFHSTAVIGIAHFLIYWFLYTKKMTFGKNEKNLRSWILIAVLAGVCVLLPYICSSLVGIGLLDAKYLYYFKNESVSNNLFQTIIYLLQIFMTVVYSCDIRQNMKESEFFKTNLFFTFITLQLTNVMYYGNRISLYFGIVNVVLIAFFLEISNSKRSKFFTVIIITFIALTYWVYVYVIGNSSNTYPYIPYWVTTC